MAGLWSPDVLGDLERSTLSNSPPDKSQYYNTFFILLSTQIRQKCLLFCLHFIFFQHIFLVYICKIFYSLYFCRCWYYVVILLLLCYCVVISLLLCYCVVVVVVAVLIFCCWWWFKWFRVILKQMFGCFELTTEG